MSSLSGPPQNLFSGVQLVKYSQLQLFKEAQLLLIPTADFVMYTWSWFCKCAESKGPDGFHKYFKGKSERLRKR
jgi:hypothetical protein